MLIGIDASRANRSRKTGTEWYSYHLIRELAKVDDKNQYILYSDRPLTGGLADLSLATADSAAPLDFDGKFQIIKSPFNNFKGQVLRWPWPIFWTLGRLSLEMLNPPDCLFVPAHTLPLIRPKKTLVTIHDIGFKREDNLYGDGRVAGVGGIINSLAKLFTGGRYGAGQADYLDWSTDFALRHASRVLTISQFSKNEIVEVYGVEPDKISVVHNGYDQALYQPKDHNSAMDHILQKHGIARPFIFGVGRLEKKKNTAKLIEAFALLKLEYPDLPHRLVLIGDANYGFPEIRHIINQYDLVDQVIMPGWVEEADMPYVYSAADLFVFPSNYEGFGIPLLEAMATKVPIVASQAGALPEVAQNAAVYFNQKDVREMAEKIADVLLSQDLREHLIANGQRRVSDFSWHKAALQTLEIIENL